MSKPYKPYPVLFFTGLLYRDTLDVNKITDSLQKAYGEIENIMEPIPFDWTPYYAPEMGEGLLRTWVFFKELMKPEELVTRKLRSLEIEDAYSDSEGNRILNIDPGIVTPAKLILSTFKDFSHRIYLGNSVYAEITLIYKDGDFHSLEWTYSDYQDKNNQVFFHKMRKYMKTRLGVLKKNGKV